MNDAITLFHVGLADAEIQDLRERLRRTRWPEPATAGGWAQGIPLGWIRELCRYWLEDYDFAAARERLNLFPQFRTEIGGLGSCFVQLPGVFTGEVRAAFRAFR